MKPRTVLFVIVIGYLLLGAVYSLTSPLFEVSDELWHYPMVKYLADNGLQLPNQDPASVGPWRQEGSQPPLYYMLAAVLTAGIDTSDINDVRRINPHADIGVIRPDGNANMMVQREINWTGAALAAYIIRLASLLLGLGTVLVTYQLAREIFPDAVVVHLGAAALVAFLPMFVFISGSINNDNLSNLLGNLLTLLIVRLLKSTHLPDWRDYALIGVVTGAGMLAKFNIGFLTLIIAAALVILTLRFRNWRPLVIGGLISGGLTILIAGWWYLRNWQLYGDPTGLNIFLDIVGRRAIPANAAQLWSERDSFLNAFWGFFGGMNVPMPNAIYAILNLIGLVGLIGAAAFMIAAVLQRPPLYRLAGWLPAAVTIIWPLVTFISYLRWTAETPASQGRLVFAALSSIMLWLAVGLTWWLPGKLRPWVMTSVAGFLGVVAALAPFLVIAPTYAAPPPPDTLPTTSEAQFVAPSGPVLELMRATVSSASVQPEGYVEVEMVWRVEQPTDRDWSLFLHLVTPDDVIVGQRDVYPGQGRLATSDLQPGDVWINPAAIWVPPAAYAPQTLTVEVGWYHLLTGERLTLPNGEETYRIGQVALQPRPSEYAVPNPISINFGGMIELIGYELTDLSPQAGETIELTLYWRALTPIIHDYKVFANILDPATLTKYAASDGMPVQWQRPTTTWQPHEIIADTHTLAVNPDTPPGIYELELGLYRETGDGFQRLRIRTPDGGQANDFTYLSRVRIELAAAESDE